VELDFHLQLVWDSAASGKQHQLTNFELARVASAVVKDQSPQETQQFTQTDQESTADRALMRRTTKCLKLRTKDKFNRSKRRKCRRSLQ